MATSPATVSTREGAAWARWTEFRTCRLEAEARGADAATIFRCEEAEREAHRAYVAARET